MARPTVGEEVRVLPPRALTLTAPQALTGMGRVGIAEDPPAAVASALTSLTEPKPQA